MVIKKGNNHPFRWLYFQIGETKMEDFRLQLWLSRFTAQEIDDILAVIHLLKLARANDSIIEGTGMKESEYYSKKVSHTISYLTAPIQISE